MNTATIWTGAHCQDNPGPGAYAVTVQMPDGSNVTKSNGRRLTTPLRMELYAAIRGLTILEPGQQVTLKTSSKYIVNGINARAYDSNTDLWSRLMEAAGRHCLRAAWQKHGTDKTGVHTLAEATRTSRLRHPKADTGYENNSGFRS